GRSRYGPISPKPMSTSAISFRARKHLPRPSRPIVKPFRCVRILPRRMAIFAPHMRTWANWRRQSSRTARPLGPIQKVPPFAPGSIISGVAAALVFAKTQPGQTVGYDMERQRPVSARIIERVARHAPDGRWLDVGFGNGSLLFTAEEWGYMPVGLDLRGENVR